MTTIDRIDRLIGATPTGAIRVAPGIDLHSVLNKLDAALGADTEWLSSLECSCLWHIGKVCHNRRPVGARVALLEARLTHKRYEESWRQYGLAPGFMI